MRGRGGASANTTSFISIGIDSASHNSLSFEPRFDILLSVELPSDFPVPQVSCLFISGMKQLCRMDLVVPVSFLKLDSFSLFLSGLSKGKSCQ